MNLTKSALLIGVTGLISGTASATVFDNILVVPLGSGQFSTTTFQVYLENEKDVVGWSWGGDYTYTGGSFASEFYMNVIAPDGTNLGYINGGELYYSSETSAIWFKEDPIERVGLWTFTLIDTFGGGADFGDLHVTLYKVPAPGAVALLGLAGLAGTRRRRR